MSSPSINPNTSNASPTSSSSSSSNTKERPLTPFTMPSVVYSNINESQNQNSQPPPLANRAKKSYILSPRREALANKDFIPSNNSIPASTSSSSSPLANPRSITSQSGIISSSSSSSSPMSPSRRHFVTSNDLNNMQLESEEEYQDFHKLINTQFPSPPSNPSSPLSTPLKSSPTVIGYSGVSSPINRQILKHLPSNSPKPNLTEALCALLKEIKDPIELNIILLTLQVKYQPNYVDVCIDIADDDAPNQRHSSSSSVNKSWDNFSPLFPKILTFPSDTIESIAEKVQSLLPSIIHWKHALEIAKNTPASTSPKHNIDHTVSLFQNLSIHGTGEATFNQFTSLDQNDQVYLFQNFMSEIKNINEDPERANFIKFILLVQENQRKTDAHAILRLVKMFSTSELTNLVPIIPKIPRDILSETIYEILPLFKYEFSVQTFPAITELAIKLFYINKISSIELHATLTSFRLKHSTHIAATEYYDFLLKVEETSFTEALDDYNLSYRHIKDLIPFDKKLIEFPRAKQMCFWKLYAKLVSGSDSINSVITFLSLFEKYDESFLKEDYKLQNLIEDFDIIPLALRRLVMGSFINLKKEKTLQGKTPLAFVANSFDQEQTNQLAAHLSVLLEQTESLEQALRFARSYDDLYWDLKNPNADLNRLHIVAQTIASLLRQTINDSFNPYNIISSLRNKKKHQALPSTAFLTRIDNIPVCLNFKGWQEKALILKHLYKNLPKNISRITFEQFFTDSDNRLNQLSQNNNALCIEQINKLFSHQKYKFTTFNALRTRIMAVHQSIPKYFVPISSDPNQEVSEHTVHLYQIINYLKSLNRIPVNEQVLSEFEIKLIELCREINECSDGQDDGTTYFNNKLPLEFRSKISAESSSSTSSKCKIAKKIESAIELEMQHFLNTLFNNAELQAKLLESDSNNKPLLVNDSQSSHFTISLKDHFYREFGLKHTVKFSINMGFIPEQLKELLKNNRSFIVDTIISFMTIQQLRDVIQKSIYDDIHSKKIYNFSGLVSYFESNLEKIPSSLRDIKELIILDKSTNSYMQLSDTGATLILYFMDYVTLEGLE